MIYSPDSTQLQLAELLLLKITEHLPNYKKPDLQKWAKTMDDILRLDQRTPEEIREVIIFAQEDQFWQTNILSPTKVREHFDRLNLKRLQKKTGPLRAAKTRPTYQRKGNDDDGDEYAGFFK